MNQPFRVYESAQDHNWYFSVEGKNGEIVAPSEGYSSKANAMQGLQDLVEIVVQAAKLEVAGEVDPTSVEVAE
jgi:uncharacterized protein YegP (UPF0339 family)